MRAIYFLLATVIATPPIHADLIHGIAIGDVAATSAVVWAGADRPGQPGGEEIEQRHQHRLVGVGDRSGEVRLLRRFRRTREADHDHREYQRRLRHFADGVEAELFTQARGEDVLAGGFGLDRVDGHVVRAVGRRLQAHVTVVDEAETAVDLPCEPEPAGTISEEDEGRILSIYGAVRLGSSFTNLGGLLFFFAMLNIFLGVFNLLPVLPLDGGHAVIALYEGWRRRTDENYSVDVTKVLPIAYMVSLGNRLKFDLHDAIHIFARQDRVTALGLFVETMPDPKAFQEAVNVARELAKPIVAIKVGRSKVAQKMVVSHTASLAGSDALVSALFERLGVARVDSLEALMEALMPPESAAAEVPQERFDLAAAAEGGVVLIEGEAGSGKTRLVDELEEHVEAAGR